MIPTDVIEDEFEGEVPKEPKSKLGEIYQLGNHRLMCGDATDYSKVTKLMNGKEADLVLTDPPYNTGMTGITQAGGNPNTLWKGKGKKSGSAKPSHMFEDSYTDEEWDNFLTHFLAVYQKIMKENCAFYCFLDWRRMSELIPKIKKHFHLSNIIVWDKVVHGLGSDYKYTYELIAVAKQGKPVLKTHQNKEYKDVWNIQREMGRNENHATAKPITVLERPIRHATTKGQIVVDLFGGSGSTLIAAEQLERKCYMMEIDPGYIDVIINRWESFTGEKAVKL